MPGFISKTLIKHCNIGLLQYTREHLPPFTDISTHINLQPLLVLEVTNGVVNVDEAPVAIQVDSSPRSSRSQTFVTELVQIRPLLVPSDYHARQLGLPATVLRTKRNNNEKKKKKNSR